MPNFHRISQVPQCGAAKDVLLIRLSSINSRYLMKKDFPIVFRCLSNCSSFILFFLPVAGGAPRRGRSLRICNLGGECKPAPVIFQNVRFLAPTHRKTPHTEERALASKSAAAIAASDVTAVPLAFAAALSRSSKLVLKIAHLTLSRRGSVGRLMLLGYARSH